MRRESYRAIAHMYRFAPQPTRLLAMYVSGRGRFPRQVQVRTPIGTITPTLYSYHDLLTLNEVFFRMDYKAPSTITFAVDIGSNIGISALYFLTRNEHVHCALAEPVPSNVERLRTNLAPFDGRWTLSESAVDAQSGVVRFGVEATGRYGGIGKATDDVRHVACIGINDYLQTVAPESRQIDVLKVDTEGAELRTVSAIRPEYLTRIRHICMESPRGIGDLIMPGFSTSRVGGVYHFDRVKA